MDPASISVFHLLLTAVAGSWLPAAAGGFTEAAASMAVTAVWQGALVATFLAVALRISPRISATHRFIFWAAGFALSAALAFFPMLASLAASPLGSSASGVASASAGPWLEVDSRWSLAITALWIAASVFKAIQLAMQALHLRKLASSASPALLESCPFPSGSVHIPGRGQVKICTTKLLESPGAIGFFTPRILIPEWLQGRLTTAEFKQIVLHEAEHLRRRDDWTNLAEKICLAIFPLNPVLWWIDRRLLMEREMACDEGVVRATREPHSYAACLTSLAESKLRQRAEVLSLGAWRRRPELVSRVQSILAQKNATAPWTTRLLASTIICGLLVASAEFIRSPQLIAFVPQQSGKAQQADARLIAEANPSPRNTGMRPAQAGDGWAIPAVTYTKAILPTAQPPAQKPARASRAPSGPGRNTEVSSPVVQARISAPVASAQAVENAPHEVIAKAELPGTEQIAAAQQWIVFTAWQQVRSPSAGSGESVPQRGAACGSDFVTDGEAQAGEVPTDVVVIEQFVLKVVPVVYHPVPAAKAQIRAGWLVIQL